MDLKPDTTLDRQESLTKAELEDESISAPQERVPRVTPNLESELAVGNNENLGNLALDQTGFEVSNDIRRDVTEQIAREEISSVAVSTHQTKSVGSRSQIKPLLQTKRAVLEESILDKAISWIAEVFKALDRMIFRKAGAETNSIINQNGAVLPSKRRKRNSLDEEDEFTSTRENLGTQQDGPSGGANLAGR